jgi:hypothetical protein
MCKGLYDEVVCPRLYMCKGLYDEVVCPRLYMPVKALCSWSGRGRFDVVVSAFVVLVRLHP